MKGTKEDVRRIAAGEQVEKYLKHRGLVLVANLRGFLLVARRRKQPIALARKLFAG